MIVQEVERTWNNNQLKSSKPESIILKDSLSSIPHSNKSNYSITSAASFKQQRTKSLCVFYNSSIVNYANNLKSSTRNNKECRKLSNSNQRMQKDPIRDMKILQNHEKILEAQNKWTGNGKFLIKEKSSFLVSKFRYFYIY